MKFIVLYGFVVSAIFSLDTAGQKPFIELLPSDHEIQYRYRVRETGNIIRPAADIPIFISDCPAADSSRVVHHSIREREERPVKQPVPFYRLIIPIKMMILDLTAYKK